MKFIYVCLIASIISNQLAAKKPAITPSQALAIGNGIESLLQTTDTILTQTPQVPLSQPVQTIVNGLATANHALLTAVELGTEVLESYLAISHDIHAIIPAHHRAQLIEAGLIVEAS